MQQSHLPIWFGGDADPVLQRTARYATGWWPFRTPPESIPERIEFIKSQPDYNGGLKDVCYGMSTSRVSDGHAAADAPAARVGQSRDEIIDRLGVLGEPGVTISSVPIPQLRNVEEYFDYTQWVAERIMPVFA